MEENGIYASLFYSKRIPCSQEARNLNKVLVSVFLLQMGKGLPCTQAADWPAHKITRDAYVKASREAKKGK